MSNRTDLPELETWAWKHRVNTGSSGIEVVVISNLFLDEVVTLSSGLVLVPCFPSDRNTTDLTSPLIALTHRMRALGRFVYDGWMPVLDWSELGVRDSVRRIATSLSVFSLVGDVRFEWDHKYRAKHSLSFDAAKRDLEYVSKFDAALNSLPETDCRALYRTVGWLAESRRTQDIMMKFLYLVNGVESLAQYIEEECKDGSPLDICKTDKRPKAQQKQERENCIKSLYDAAEPGKLYLAASDAYFNCVVSIQNRIKTHLINVLGSEESARIEAFFSRSEQTALYKLRSGIAHGRTDPLASAEIHTIATRLLDAEQLCRQYVEAVLRLALKLEPPTPIDTDVITLDLSSGTTVGFHATVTHVGMLYF